MKVINGIVVVGDTQQQAAAAYRQAAKGNIKVFGDKSLAIATNAKSPVSLLNPTTGEEMRVKRVENYSFVAKASGTAVEPDYVVCGGEDGKSGCGSHIVSSGVEVTHCPACASSVRSVRKPEVYVATGSSIKEVVQNYMGLCNGSIPAIAHECADKIMLSNAPLELDMHTCEPVIGVIEDYVPTTAVASSSGEFGGNYYATASTSDAVHVMCSDDSPLFCPTTGQALLDFTDSEESERIKQAALAASGCAGDDDEEDEDDDDEEPDDDEDDEDEELDDDEDDEDEELDDDEDDGGDLSLSVASSKKGKNKATASNKGQRRTGGAVPKTTEVKASFISTASATDIKKLDVSYVGEVAGEPTWVAFFDGVPFAKAVASTAADPATFADVSYGRAFKAIAKESGIGEALAQLNFEEIQPVITVEKAVASEIEKAVASETKEVKAQAQRDAQQLAERFEAALAIASQGINNGYFEIENPVMVALSSALKEVGIDNADSMIRKVFNEHNDELHQAMVAKASEILDYDLTVQNQLATAVSSVKPQGITSTASSSFPVGRTVPSQQQQRGNTATASAAKDNDMDDFMSRLGQVKFNR